MGGERGLRDEPGSECLVVEGDRQRSQQGDEAGVRRFQGGLEEENPEERREAVLMAVSIFAVEGGLAYGIYRLVIRYAYSR